MTRLLVLVVASSMLCGCAATLAVCPDEGGTPWRELRTTHFNLRTNLSSEGAHQSALELEQFRAAILSLLFPDSPELPSRLDVIVLRTPTQLSEFVAPGIAGYFARGGPGQLMVMTSHAYLAGDYGLELSIVAHELTHYLSSFALARQPTWFAEGFATYMETARVDPDGRVEMGGLPTSILLAAQRHRVPVKTLWEWRGGPMKHETAPDLYASSWLLVHALINLYPDGFGAFLGRLAAAEDPRKAFEASFPGITDDALDRVLASYVSSGQYAVLQVQTREEGTAIRERALTPADAHLIRARIWGQSPNGLSEAVTIQRALGEADEALRHDPKNPAALILRQQLAPTSVGAQALVDLFPEDPRAWKELADSLRAHPAREAEALDRALKLGSDDSHVLGRRAQLHLDADAPQLALPLAEKAAALQPYAMVALLRLSRVHSKLGDCPQAQRWLRRALERHEGDGRSRHRDIMIDELRRLERACSVSPAEG